MGISPISQKPPAFLEEEAEAQKKGVHSWQRLSWEWKNRAQVSSAKGRVPGKASSLKWDEVGWGGDSLLSPQ